MMVNRTLVDKLPAPFGDNDHIFYFNQGPSPRLVTAQLDWESTITKRVPKGNYDTEVDFITKFLTTV